MAGIVTSMADRAYYTMIFLPSHHGSFSESSKQLVDLSGFMAFLKTKPGGILFGLTALLFLVAAALAFFPSRQANQALKRDGSHGGVSR